MTGEQPLVARAVFRSSAGGSEVELLLNPDPSSRVAVHLIEKGGSVDVAVRSDSAPLRSLLSDSLSSLTEGLRERGLDVTRVIMGSAGEEPRWTGGSNSGRSHERSSETHEKSARRFQGKLRGRAGCLTAFSIDAGGRPA